MIKEIKLKNVLYNKFDPIIEYNYYNKSNGLI